MAKQRHFVLKSEQLPFCLNGCGSPAWKRGCVGVVNKLSHHNPQNSIYFQRFQAFHLQRRQRVFRPLALTKWARYPCLINNTSQSLDSSSFYGPITAPFARQSSLKDPTREVQRRKGSGSHKPLRFTRNTTRPERTTKVLGPGFCNSPRACSHVTFRLPALQLRSVGLPNLRAACESSSRVSIAS